MDTDALVRLSRRLARRCDDLAFAAPVAHVYNPLAYARAPLERYLSRFGAGPKELLFLGMNPGPFGMVQTGVPFGEVAMARDFLGCEAPVARPAGEHPRRPIEGFACTRSEVSGARLWGWVRRRFGSAEAFFARAFVWNYCPLAFLEASGRNLTPDKLPRSEREPLFAACDEALRGVVEALRPRVLVGVGLFAETQARVALAGHDVVFARLPHPSPASPAANRGWDALADAALAPWLGEAPASSAPAASPSSRAAPAPAAAPAAPASTGRRAAPARAPAVARRAPASRGRSGPRSRSS